MQRHICSLAAAQLSRGIVARRHGTWQPLPEMLSCRSGGLAVWTGGGVLAIGGHGGGGAAGDFSQRGYVLRAAEYLAGPAGQGVGSQGLLSEAAEWEPWPAMR